MNAERLLQHYEQIADAPDAIARLRRFILDLAVRGKLVPQEPKDEPASELLKRLATKKGRLVEAARTRGRNTSPRDPAEPMYFDCPAGWTLTELGEVALKITDGTHKTPTYVEKGIPFISVKDFSGGKLDFSSTRFISEKEHRLLYKRCDPRRGDILIARIGTLGKAVLVDTDIEFSLFVSVGLIRFDHLSIDPVFLRFLLNSPFVEAEFDRIKIGGGTHTNKLNLGDLQTVVIPLPPLAEQHRIVAKINELMELCNRLETARAGRERSRDRLAAASLARLHQPDPETFQDDGRFAINALPALTTRPDQIKHLRQTIVNLAVHGKLVPQNATDEPASELLKQIAKERTGPQAVKKARRNGETDVFNLREDTPLPVGWLRTNIAEIALSMRYGTSTKCEYAAPGVPVLRIPNVSGGVVSLHDIKFGPLTDGEIRDLALNAGDLLMIRSNGSLDIVGRSAVVTDEAEGMAFAGYLVRLRLSLTNVNPRYIWLALRSTSVRDQIEKPIRSAVGLKNVNLTEFGALTFALPPLPEQHRIVAKVDELLTLCDQLEVSLTTAVTARSRLLEALLVEALEPTTVQELQAAE